jgi:7,8-dihydro-6-hydroxymethylpterin-pyrophosphokinase
MKRFDGDFEFMGKRVKRCEWGDRKLDIDSIFPVF